MFINIITMGENLREKIGTRLLGLIKTNLNISAKGKQTIIQVMNKTTVCG